MEKIKFHGSKPPTSIETMALTSKLRFLQIFPIPGPPILHIPRRPPAPKAAEHAAEARPLTQFASWTLQWWIEAAKLQDVP